MGQDPSPAGNIRIGDRERDAVAAVLQEAAGDGRLSMAELDGRVAAALPGAAGNGRLGVAELADRLAAAFQAKTYADLDPLVADLSVELPSHSLSSGRAAAPGPARARDARTVHSPPRP